MGMIDMEKVIKDLDECLSASCRGFRPRLLCPYNDEEWNIMRDALALLKERDAVALLTIDDAVSEIMDKHYKRLKEQEPVLDSFLHKRCPSCGALLIGKFCHECGQAVKLNDD